MPEEDDPDDIRRLLSQRADVLAVLVERPHGKKELTAELDVSRSTVDRTVRRLESNGLVRRTGGQVEATLAGRLAYESHSRYCDQVGDVARFSDLLAELPPSADVGHEFLREATAYRSEPPATGRPSNEVLTLWRQGARIRSCAKVINDRTATEVIHRQITERDTDGEFVFTSDLAAHVRQQYFDICHDMVSTGRLRLYEVESIPFELFLVDGEGWARAVVLIYSESEALRGAIVNDTDDAIAYAEETFERYREAATEFTDEFLLDEAAE